MKTLIFLLIFGHLAFALKSSASGRLEAVYREYKSADYEKALNGLEEIEAGLALEYKQSKEMKGLLYYWKGLCYLRMNEFERGIGELDKAIAAGYKANDLFYEYGQALYTSLELKKARLAFKKSVLQKYKMAVSMYYIASISEELGDFKTAATFYNGIERLPAQEKEDVVQAARMRLGDIYLRQVKERDGGADSIEKYVLPQYRKALEWDDEGALAAEIRSKIQTIERRYDLVMFKLRNGRPTARPPYFLKANVRYSQNDNVNAVDDDTIAGLKPEQVSANSANTGFYGRYSFYPSSAFSFTPQINFSYTNYLSDEALIKQNNGYFATATLQTTYEHIYNSAPATAYLNIDYTHTADDGDQDDKIEKSSSTTGFTLSEELQFWTGNPTIFRLKASQTSAVEESESFTSTGAVLEQVLAVGSSMFYLYSGYSMNRYDEDSSSDTNVLSLRADALLPDFKGLFNTNFYAAFTQTDYFENSDRGAPLLTSYGVNLNRPFGKNYFVYLDFSVSSQKGDQDSDNYSQNILSVNFDYIF